VLELAETPAAEAKPDRGRVDPVPFETEIVLDTVSYGHGGSVFALRDIDLIIPRGACIGLTGPTGSGKSTLIDLLIGLLEPDAGEIRIDGRRLDLDSRVGWQARIAHVPQSIHLADDTIAANIAFGDRDVDETRVQSAAAAACLDGFIAELPEGYGTRVGERGILLSGGQRQRLGIARALYKATPVLILDEATSALDEDTEREVMRSVLSMRDQLTIVIVAHRLSTLANCDRILRLEKGRLVEGLSAGGSNGARLVTVSLDQESVPKKQ
jgi:ABC-type multidrug transport system fused ATPase/permease subunit